MKTLIIWFAFILLLGWSIFAWSKLNPDTRTERQKLIDNYRVCVTIAYSNNQWSGIEECSKILNQN